MRWGWRRIAAVLGGIGAAAFIGGAALYSYHQFYEPAEYEYPAERYQPARDTSYPIPTKQKAQTEAYDPHCDQPQDRDDADLCAQWGAVRAVNETNRLTRTGLKLATVGFWVAFLGGLLGAIGTGLLVLTFRENKRAADAAHDANRPWLELEVTHDSLWVGETVELGLQAKVINRGRSPATNLMPLSKLLLFNMKGGPIDKNVARDAIIAQFRLLKEAETQHGTALFPERHEIYDDLVASAEPGRLEEVCNPPDPILPLVVVGVRYRFNGRTFYTIETFSLMMPSDFRDFSTKMGFAPEHLRLIRHQSSYVV